MAKRALITGVTGQDGAYLARLLLDKGYAVFGTCRDPRLANGGRLAELGIEQEVALLPMDLVDDTSVRRAIKAAEPDEVYNLAAQTYVARSFEEPVYTGDADGLGVVRLLDAVRAIAPGARFFQASTSEMYGRGCATRQDERTAFSPGNPYGIAKLYAHGMTRSYREAYGMHASTAILFNHESPHRGIEFVTRKITATFAAMRQGREAPLELGNLEAARDWGFAGDYVEGMWRIVQAETAEDFVLATGTARTVREFVETAAWATGFELAWDEEDGLPVGRDRLTGRRLLQTNPAFLRSTEASSRVGNAGKAEAELGWRPTVGFEALVEMMVRTDLDRATRGVLRL